MLLSHHMLTFGTQLVPVPSPRDSPRAESQASSSRGELKAAIKPKAYLCGSEIISLNLPYLAVVRDPQTNVARPLLYKQSYKKASVLISLSGEVFAERVS